MALTTTSNLEASQKALGIYFDEVVVGSLQPNLYFEQFGEVEEVPQGNFTSRFFNVNSISTSSVSVLTEGTPPTAISLSVNAIDVTPTQYGIHIGLTDLVALTAVFNAIDLMLDEVGKVMARKIDEVIQAVVHAGTNVIYAGGKNTRSALGAGDLFDISLLNKAAHKLRGNSAPEFRGGGYVCVMHPSVAHDLKSNTSVGQWIDVYKYASPQNIFKGEVGSLYGVRIVESPNVITFSSTVTVYPTTVIADRAYKISYWLAEGGTERNKNVPGAGRMKIYVLPPEGYPSVSNPLGQEGSVGAKTNMAVARTQEARLVRIESAATPL